MTCPHCLTALSRPHHGLYDAACQGCQMRQVAQGPAYWESSRAGAITPAYRSQLERLFGEEWQAGHQRVKAMATTLARAA